MSSATNSRRQLNEIAGGAAQAQTANMDSRSFDDTFSLSLGDCNE